MHTAPSDVVLPDGTNLRVRRIRPEDRDRLEQGWEGLSADSRYMRFQHVVEHLSDEQLRRFTEVDHRDHVAWIALDTDHPEVPGAGVGRYIRLSDEPTVAEAALTVADEYQGRGIGTLLLSVLVEDALDNGVEVFRNYILEENESMLGLFDGLGATCAPEGDGVLRVDLPLPDDVADLPQTPVGRTMRQVRMAGHLAMQPPVWIRDHDDGAGDADRPARQDEDRSTPGSGSLRDWLDDVLDDVE